MDANNYYLKMHQTENDDMIGLQRDQQELADEIYNDLVNGEADIMDALMDISEQDLADLKMALQLNNELGAGRTILHAIRSSLQHAAEIIAQ